jgi:transposase
MRSAKTAEEYRKRVVLWLTHFEKWSARDIGEMTGASVQSVWLWVGQYNEHGPDGLERTGRGGRRWAFLSEEAEQKFLSGWEERAGQGQIITVKQMHGEVCRRIGKQVSLDYVYRLLHRNRWRKLGPRLRHVKANTEEQDAFKKNSLRR